MNSGQDLVTVALTDDERYLLTVGISDWDEIAPARATDAIAQAMGYADAKDLCDVTGPRLAAAIRKGEALTRGDWVRALAAAEIAFASDVLGTGSEWTVINGGQEEFWIVVLRRLQAKLHSLHDAG
jgi:hypothetical protein